MEVPRNLGGFAVIVRYKKPTNRLHLLEKRVAIIHTEHGESVPTSGLCHFGGVAVTVRCKELGESAPSFGEARSHQSSAHGAWRIGSVVS